MPTKNKSPPNRRQMAYLIFLNAAISGGGILVILRHIGADQMKQSDAGIRRAQNVKENEMKAIRIDEYHKYGCNFYGKLVAVDYTAEVMSVPCTVHSFGRGLPELDQAKNLVADLGYKVKRELLHIPEYVVELQD